MVLKPALLKALDAFKESSSAMDLLGGVAVWEVDEWRAVEMAKKAKTTEMEKTMGACHHSNEHLAILID